jgi:glucose/arabinose dehydrogenase
MNHSIFKSKPAVITFWFVLTMSLAQISSLWALPAGFSKTVYANLPDNQVTAMAFAPDGRLFVCLQGNGSGNTATASVRVIKDGLLLSKPFVSVQVNPRGERGLLGIAFDPNFEVNHHVYLHYMKAGDPTRNRISRFTASGDVAAPGSEVIIRQLQNLPDTGSTIHNGGAIHFGSDGKLYVAVGDHGDRNSAQNPDSYNGKLLRFNPNGSTPSDNPLFNSADGITARDRIWTSGLRNPYTFAVQPGTGKIYLNDVGQNSWEEINHIFKGANYGWPIHEGFKPSGNTDASTNPIYVYDHSQGCTIIGAAFYNPPLNTFGSSYLNKFFFGDYCSNFIRYFDSATGGATHFDTVDGGVIDIRVGNDGALYVLTRASGIIYRIQNTGTTPQELIVTPTSRTITEGNSGWFNLRLAKQPVSNMVARVFLNSGTTSISLNRNQITFTPTNWNSPQYFSVTGLQDGDRYDGSYTFRCSVSGLPNKKVVYTILDDDHLPGYPRARITRPLNGDTVSGTNAEFFGDGTDSNGTPVRARFYVDDVLLDTDENNEGHYHINGTHNAWNTTTIPNGWHRLRMEVEDNAGNRSSHEVQVRILN